jgi:hypothetical protein
MRKIPNDDNIVMLRLSWSRSNERVPVIYTSRFGAFGVEIGEQNEEQHRKRSEAFYYNSWDTPKYNIRKACCREILTLLPDPGTC